MAEKHRTSPLAAPPPLKIPLGPDNSLVLTALRDDNPRDFLAALGVLRLLDYLWPASRPTLCWSANGNPVLHASSLLPETWTSDIWRHLISLNESAGSPFRHGKIEMIDCVAFRRLLESPEEMSPFQMRFYPALCAQIPYEKGGRRSHLIIESANRSVLNGVADMLSPDRFIPDIGADFTGISPLAEVSNTPRWHPAEAQSAAYCAADPKDNKLMDRRSLNVFAVIGLTFYPVVDQSRQRETLGTEKRFGENRSFTWPVSEQALDCDSLSTLLHDRTLHAREPDATELRMKGVRMAWRSRRFNLNQNDYFSPAEPLL